MNTITLSMNDEIYDKLMVFIDTLPENSIRKYKGEVSESEIIQMIANNAVKEAQIKNLSRFTFPRCNAYLSHNYK